MHPQKRVSIPVLLILSLTLVTWYGCVSDEYADQRIVVLSPNQTEICYALGIGDRVVGWTRYCNYPPDVQHVPGWVRYDHYRFEGIAQELSKVKAVVSSFTSVNTALIDSLRPDLILSTHGPLRGAVEQLRAKGYDVLHYEPETLEDVFTMMEEIGDATGRSRLARTLTGRYRSEIEEIRERTRELPKVGVYFEISHYGPWILGSGSPMDEIIEYAGGRNVFEDVQESDFPGEWDEVVRRNPDVILTPLWPAAGRDEVTTIREIVTRSHAGEIRAVLNSRVYHYDSSLFKRPGPRQVTAIRKLVYLLHPYHFKNPEDSVDPWELGKIDATYPAPAALK